MERLQIDEQLRQIGGGPRAPPGRPEKEKPFMADNGMGPSRGGSSKPFGRGGRGRRGPTLASGMTDPKRARHIQVILFYHYQLTATWYQIILEQWCSNWGPWSSREPQDGSKEATDFVAFYKMLKFINNCIQSNIKKIHQSKELMLPVGLG